MSVVPWVVSGPRADTGGPVNGVTHLSLTCPQVSVLVMCHTRELAFQISKEYERFSKYMPSVKDNEKNRKLFDLLDVLEFNQVTQNSLEWPQKLARMNEKIPAEICPQKNLEWPQK
ncbi:hypothetical protein TURU_011226 [Turdus rufiventris]|nr:hypothetical protein TURU_011226 [Turdus rufiventris]